MDIELPPDFKEFLRLLNAHRVEYLLIGGYAVGFYGYPRATNDLDIWIAVHPANAEKMVAVLKDFGFNTPELNSQLFLEEDRIVRMGLPPIRIEVATKISGVDFANCYAQRVVERMEDIEIPFISLPNLKANKKAAGRHKDLDDLEHLP